jgi:hypothetical protein
MGLANAEARAEITTELELEGYVVHNTHSAYELRLRLNWAALAHEPYELVVLDLDLRGPPVLTALPCGPAAPKVIVFASSLPEAINKDAERLGAVVVDRWLGAGDVRDTAVGLVAPMLLSYRPGHAAHPELCFSVCRNRWLRRPPDSCPLRHTVSVSG